MADASAPADPTTKPTVSGIVEAVSDDQFTLKVPGSDYRLHLVPANDLKPKVGQKLTGYICARALRMDIIPAGGRYIEPVFGRPRNIQGRIIGGNIAGNEVYISAGAGLIITPMAPQRAGDFAVGQMVTFGVRRGATFEVTSV